MKETRVSPPSWNESALSGLSALVHKHRNRHKKYNSCKKYVGCDVDVYIKSILRFRNIQIAIDQQNIKNKSYSPAKITLFQLQCLHFHTFMHQLC